MKQFVIILTFIWINLSSFSQNPSGIICRFGFTYEMSQHPGWGHDKPIVLSVTPLSPADASGLKINDMIETINGTSTQGQMLETITERLQNSSEKYIKLTVSNLRQSNKEISLYKDCKLANAVSEKELASVYSFYSLEDVQTRAFTCPFKTTLNSKANISNYKTFGFPAVDDANRSLEEVINKGIRTALENKGLVFTNQNPDLIVHTYYSYNKNLNYSPSENVDKFPIECRYNLHTQAMENLPIYFNPLINSKQAELLLNLGVRLIDKKLSNGNNLFIVWECEANELLQSDYTLEKYAQFHIPLLLMQYPYPKTMETAQFYLSQMKYNYTGIFFNLDNLKEVVDIDQHSPADKAGLQPGDIIEKINGIKFNNDPETASNDYKQFILETMSMRDVKTQFTNAEGFTRCMYWDKMQYASIAAAFKKKENSTAFSYLFYFEPFINLSETNIISFSIRRDKEKLEIKVTPTIRTEMMFENK